MQLGFSHRKGVPALFLNGSKVAFPLWAFKYLSQFEKSHFKLTPYAQNVLGEVRQGFYRPPFSLTGKTVLDLGACCGETAWYFLEVLGAKRVICVECDPANIRLLEENRRVSGLDFEIIAEPFNLHHLELSYDFVKCDVEGAEWLLAEFIERFGFVKPCVVEVHNEASKKRFGSLGFRVAKTFVAPAWTCYIMNNFVSVIKGEESQ